MAFSMLEGLNVKESPSALSLPAALLNEPFERPAREPIYGLPILNPIP